MKVLGLNRILAASVAASASLLASACYAQGRGTVDPPRIPPSRKAAVTEAPKPKMNDGNTYALITVTGKCTSTGTGDSVYLDRCTSAVAVLFVPDPTPTDPKQTRVKELVSPSAIQQGGSPVIYDENGNSLGSACYRTWSATASGRDYSLYQGATVTIGIKFRGYFVRDDANNRWEVIGANSSDSSVI